MASMGITSRSMTYRRPGCPSYFNKGNYTKQKNAMIRALLGADFVITDRRYIGHEDDTGFHHYAIDVAKHYGMED